MQVQSGGCPCRHVFAVYLVSWGTVLPTELPDRWRVAFPPKVPDSQLTIDPAFGEVLGKISGMMKAKPTEVLMGLSAWAETLLQSKEQARHLIDPELARTKGRPRNSLHSRIPSKFEKKQHSCSACGSKDHNKRNKCCPNYKKMIENRKRISINRFVIER